MRNCNTKKNKTPLAYRQSRNGVIAMTIFILIWFSANAIICFMFYDYKERCKIVYKDPVHTDAKIIDIRRSYSRSNSIKSVRIEYKDCHGNVYQCFVTESFGENRHNGEIIQICYARNTPEIFVVTEPEVESIFFEVSSVFLIGDIIFLYVYYCAIKFYAENVKKRRRHINAHRQK